MKLTPRTSFAAAAVIFLASCASAPQATDTAAPRKTLDAWAATFKSGDADAMIAFYDDSEQVTVIESMGAARHGPRGVRGMFERDYLEAKFEDSRLVDFRMQRRGAVAWGSGIYTAKTVYLADGTPYEMRVHAAFVLVEDGDGRWKIHHEHFSPIQGVPRIRRR